MRIIATVIVKNKFEKTGQFRYLIQARPDMIICQAGETPMDLLLEFIASRGLVAGSLEKTLDILSSKGLSHNVACILPGAYSFIQIQDGFQVAADHYFTIRSENEDWEQSSTISIDGADAIEMYRSSFACAPERQMRVMQQLPVFYGLNDGAPKDNPKQHLETCGSVLAGFLAAAFEKQEEYDPGMLRNDLLILAVAAGVNAGLDFRTGSNASNMSWAISGAKHAIAAAYQQAVIVSDRGWNPRAIRRGARLDDYIAAAQGKAFRFGHAVSDVLRDVDWQIARLATEHFISAAGHRVSDFDHYLTRLHDRELSNHKAMLLHETIGRVETITPSLV